jgi:type II secretory pathway component PulF
MTFVTGCVKRSEERMGGSSVTRSNGAGLDDLIALNDEIAALAKAGMPLERGLIGTGGDLPGRLGRLTRDLGSRMEKGASLVEALHDEGRTAPPTYRAVVEAGMRSGRLAEALQGLAGFAKTYVELRRTIGLALLYPLIVVLVGYGMFLMLVVYLVPQLLEAYVAFRIPIRGGLHELAAIGTWAWLWGPVLPLLLLPMIAAWWVSGRSSAFCRGSLGAGLRFLPGLSRVLDGAVAAQFADWMALLLEREVPWGESVMLAAEATGDPRLIKSAEAIVRSSREGKLPSESAGGSRGIPPLLIWMMNQGGDNVAVAAALRSAAATYRRRAMRRAQSMKTALPALMIVILGAAASLIYALALFGPWTAMLRAMTRLH